MSDYRDVVKKAIEEGWYLDSCGSDERYYTWGSFIDLCGMSVEDAKLPDSGGGGGDDTGKTKNVITITMQRGGDNEYTVHMLPSQAPTSDVIVSLTVDGATQMVTIPAGVTNYDTGIKGEDPLKPYASISNIAITSEDEKYKYSSKNDVQTGIFTITIINNGVKTTEQVKYGTEIELDTPAPREGYDFVWKDANGYVITGDTYTMPESNTTITGAYVVKSYTLTYNIYMQKFEGGEVISELNQSGTTSVNYGARLLNILNGKTPAKAGYTLTQWTADGSVVTSTTTMPAKDVTAERTYNLNKYNLIYQDDEGAQISGFSLYYTQETVTMTPPDKTGYTTIGWNVEIPATMPAKDITAKAVYEAIKYYIKYFVDGVEKYSEEHTYGDTIAIRPDESKVGYTFSGWDPSSLPATMPAEDISVIGSFQINTYHFTLYVDGDTYFEKDYEYGATIDKSEIPDPEKEGYTFTGWEPEIPATVPSHDVEINATFQINQYTIEYYVDNIFYSSQTLDYGAAITPAVEPEKEGYTFSGWGEVPATMPANDVRIDGTFNVNTYTLTCVSDGVVWYTKDYEYGATIDKSLVADPSKVGYTFTGWSPAIPQVMGAADVTCDAQFQINRHTLTYKVDGDVYETFEYDYGTELTPIAEPTKVGHTFSGWDDVPATMPDNDVEVNGTFEANKHDIVYMLDGEVYETISGVAYGTELSLIPDPEEREGYTFSGWEGLPAAMPDNDVEVTGTFDVNYHTLTYLLDGEQYGEQESVAYGTVLTPRENPESREGYTFSGWTGLPATMPDNDVAVNGEFIINQYTMSFVLNGEPYTSITGDYNSELIAPEVPPVTGYTFSGWQPAVPATIPANDMTFTGTMNINSWVATYKIDGNVYSSVTYNYGDTIIYPDVPKEGYDLIWDEEYATMPDYDITINGEYVEHPVPKTVYYGAILNDNKATWTDVSGMTSYEYVDNEEITNWFAFSGIPEYAEIEEKYNDGEITDEEFDEWCSAHSRVPFFSMPTTAQLIRVKNAGNVDVTNAVKPGQLVMVGTDEYQCYYIDSVVPPIADDGGFNYKITIQTK